MGATSTLLSSRQLAFPRERGRSPPPKPGEQFRFKPSLWSSPVTPPRCRPLGQLETRFADEKVVNKYKAQKGGLVWLVWKSCFDRPKSQLCQLAFGQSSSALLLTRGLVERLEESSTVIILRGSRPVLSCENGRVGVSVKIFVMTDRPFSKNWSDKVTF